jgi:DNA (cytosine-5)-methyltransferase 1
VTLHGLDLFCGAGGATRGYQLAGFTMTGVDINPQPRYCGERFFKADAMSFPLDGFDFIHASPPCQRYSQATPPDKKGNHPDLLDATRDRLQRTGRPWVIENVPNAPMRSPIILCGSQFDLTADDPATGLHLALRRHRWFESNVAMLAPGPCSCRVARREGRIGGVYGGASTDNNRAKQIRHGGYTPSRIVQAEMMGIDWMTQRELNLSIPPAYTEHLGRQLLAYVEAAA